MKCACGCGHETAIATRTDSRRGQVKGQPMRFLPGHNSLVPANQMLPATAAPQSAEIDELRIMGLRNLPDADAAAVFDARLRELERQYKRSFVERGFILLEVQERELWRHIVNPETGEAYSSFERWVVGAAPQSRSDCFAAMKAVRELRDVPAQELLQVPRCNVKVLQHLSPALRRKPEVIDAAKKKSERDFVAQIEKEHPEQHIESKRPMNLKPERTARQTIDRGIEVAMWAYGVSTREDALECALLYFLQGDCEKEEYSELSNERAWETAKARGEIPT